MIKEKQLFDLVYDLKQEHILQHWDHLTEKLQRELSEQILSLDIKSFQQQQQILSSPRKKIHKCDQFTAHSAAGHLENKEKGKEILAKRQVACLIVSGGQGSRLNFNGPKGMYPTSVIKRKSLFQIFCEKTLAASKCYGSPLPLVIMTSPINHKATLDFFEKNHFFGLSKEQLSFYCQKTLPTLDDKGNLFLETPGRISESPCGNGMALHEFYHSGIWASLRDLGIRYLNFVLIDNPLADPFDPELVAYHQKKSYDITVKCTERQEVYEKVGLLVKCSGKAKIIEYSEIPEDEKTSRDANGNFIHRCANISLYCFNMNFIKRLATNPNLEMPLHLARKSAAFLSKDGKTILPKTPNAWKFETFIFDVLPESQSLGALIYPREQCFSPLKNLEGTHNIHTVRAALLERDRHIFASISGYLPDPEKVFELSQEFYYPTKKLLQKWCNRPFPNKNYFSPDL